MSVTIDLTGKVALVTGASRGIGRATACRLAEAGASLGLCARNVELLTELASELAERYETRALVVPADLTDPDACTAAIKTTRSELGRLDILVNNAGVTADTLLARMSPEQWARVIDTNLGAAYRLTKAAARLMMKQRFGRIVNVTSVVGMRGNAGQANYAASKAGLIGFTKSVARELASRNITVNAVAPGFVATDMTAALGDEQQRKIAERVPLGRVGAADDVAGAVLFLVSPLADYVTGCVLPIDGGFAM